MPNSLLDDLEKRISETARSRFIAAQRLERRDQRISWIVAMASAYTIILTVLPYLIRFRTDTSDLLNLATVALSIVTLVSSLVVGSRHDAVNAEQHHRSALELNELKRELMLVKLRASDGPQIELENTKEFFDRYSHVLQKFSINHDAIDYARLQLERPQDYIWLSHGRKVWIWLNVTLVTNIPLTVMIVLTLSVGLLVFWYALPLRLPRV